MPSSTRATANARAATATSTRAANAALMDHILDVLFEDDESGAKNGPIRQALARERIRTLPDIIGMDDTTLQGLSYKEEFTDPTDNSKQERITPLPSGSKGLLRTIQLLNFHLTQTGSKHDADAWRAITLDEFNEFRVGPYHREARLMIDNTAKLPAGNTSTRDPVTEFKKSI